MHVAWPLAFSIAVLFAADASDATADGATPIELTLVGPGPARVRVARGTTFPCDSGDNRIIVEQKLDPGQRVLSSTPERCVCVQQTYEPFIDIDWSASGLVCRPQVCKRWGRSMKCVPAPDPTIRLRISSKRP